MIISGTKEDAYNNFGNLFPLPQGEGNQTAYLISHMTLPDCVSKVPDCNHGVCKLRVIK